MKNYSRKFKWSVLMDQNRNLQKLGLAKKAGLLAIGSEAVNLAARNGKAKLIITASDASPRALRQAQMNARNGRAVHIAVTYTKFDLGKITGRGSPGTVAILDTGLAAGFVKGLLAEDADGQYPEAAELLAAKAEALKKRKKKPPSYARKSKTTGLETANHLPGAEQKQPASTTASKGG